jgi:hypothetical protein
MVADMFSKRGLFTVSSMLLGPREQTAVCVVSVGWRCVETLGEVDGPMRRAAQFRVMSDTGHGNHVDKAAASPVIRAPWTVPGWSCDVASPAKSSLPSQSGPNRARRSSADAPTGLNE